MIYIYTLLFFQEETHLCFLRAHSFNSATAGPTLIQNETLGRFGLRLRIPDGQTLKGANFKGARRWQ